MKKRGLVVSPKLSQQDKQALKWAAERADEWYGNVTGDREAEKYHLLMIRRVNAAFKKLGIRPLLERLP